MKWNLVTFADSNFAKRQKYLEDYANSLGMKINSYSYDWFKDQEFYKKYNHILRAKKGLGYFLWKSYILNDSINKMKEGDLLFYIDCGDIFHSRLIPYVEKAIISSPCLLISGNNKNKDYTRRDCFVYMNCDEEVYWNSDQLEAGISFWRVCKKSKEIISEYLNYSCDKRIISDDPNTCGENNFPSFKEHRSDQSVLTNLAIKHGLLISHKDIRKYIECNYDKWYERYAGSIRPIRRRPIDNFLHQREKEVMQLYEN